MATAVSTQLSALTGSNTVQQMMSDVNSLKTLSALATDAAGSGDFVPTSGGTFTGNLGIEKNGATTLTLTRTNSASNFAEIEAAGGSGEQLTIKSNVSNQTGGFTAFDVGGSERLRVDSSGHVLIGTTSSTTDLAYDRKLKISGSGPALILEETDTSQMYTISALGGSLTIRDATNTVQRMTIDSSGNVGIGTNNPQNALHISSTSPRIRLTDTDTGVDHLINADSSAGSLIFNVDMHSEASGPATLFYIQGSEKVRIASSGNVDIGAQSAINGGRYLDITNTNGVATDFSILRLITQEVGSSSTTSADLFKRKNGQLTLSNNDTDSAAHLTLQVGASERMRIASTGDITFKQGVVNLESASGNPAQMNFYCETNNAHYTRIQSSPHASYSGNVVLTLPTTSGTLATTASVATTGKSIAMAIVFG